MTEPRIGLITPSFNQGWAIEDTLRSVLDQSDRGPIRFGVMDGGSDDETASILERWRERLDFCVIEADRGQSHAINKGVALLEDCEWIGWINSDDYLIPGAFRAWREMIAQAGESTVAVVGNGLAVDRDGRPLPALTRPSMVTDAVSIAHWGWAAGSACFPQPAALMRRSAYLEIGGLDEALHYRMDVDLWLRLALAGGVFETFDHEVCAYRVYDEAKTQANVPLREFEHVYALIKAERHDLVESRMRDLLHMVLDVPGGADPRYLGHFRVPAILAHLAMRPGRKAKLILRRLRNRLRARRR